MITEILGIDCCGQEIIPIAKKLKVKTNAHRNCDGTPWGWIEGCSKNICWSNNNKFNYEKAEELVNKFNEMVKTL